MNLLNLEQLQQADLAIVLGSGIKFNYSEIERIEQVAYSDLPSFPEPGVKGHTGSLSIIQTKSQKKILVFRGRFHLYEGHSPKKVQTIVRFVKDLNVSNLIITNAAGGINREFSISDLMLINSIHNYQVNHSNPDNGLLDLLNQSPLEIQSDLKNFILEREKDFDFALQQGRYAGMLGPNYETDSEINLLKSQSCDAVGMSTYLELSYAMEQGLNAAGISVITNIWSESTNAETPPTHQEVLENSQKAQEKMDQLFNIVIESYV